MGINLYAESKYEHRTWDRLVLSSKKDHLYPVEVEVISSRFRDRWPEIHFTTTEAEAHGFVGHSEEDIRFYPDSTRVRVHGVTVLALMNAMIENPELRRYLASGVDYFRKQEREEAA